MKIAIIADALDYQYAGIYYYTKELINGLMAIDQQNEYWIVRSKSAPLANANFHELVVPIPSFPGGSTYRLLATIPKLLANKGMDIVVEPRHFGPFNLPKRIKRITVIHDLSPIHFPRWHTFVSSQLQLIFLPRILKRADFIITNSAFTAKDVIKNFPFAANKTKGVLLGKESFFKPSKNPALLEKYQLEAPYILYTGTIEPRKNLPFLLTAFERLKINHTNELQLVIVGKKGWKSAPFLKAVEASPYKKDIRQLGYVPREDLVTLYSSAKVFVYPSFFEGFGLPVLEAMACGIPVLVSNTSCLPEIIGQAGKTFPLDNPTILANFIQEILTSKSLHASLSQKSITRATDFSWKKTAIETLAVFEKVMSS
ncbi:MAG: glycosyltransferase family 1 protein [Bacteroidota bacterium]